MAKQVRQEAELNFETDSAVAHNHDRSEYCVVQRTKVPNGLARAHVHFATMLSVKRLVNLTKYQQYLTPTYHDTAGCIIFVNTAKIRQ